MFVKRLTLLALASSCLTGAVAFSQVPDASLEPLAAVRAAAEHALLGSLGTPPSGIEVEAATLDPRLRLTRCGVPLATHVDTPRETQPRALVRVSCESQAWTQNVPVDIRRTVPVLVLKRAALRGEMLNANDVTTQTRVVSGIASPFVATIDEIEGRALRRPVPAGTTLTADALNPLLLIHRGQSVTLAVSFGGIEVKAPGQALADAGPGALVRVRNLDSLKIIEGVADSEGVVRVRP